MQPDLTRRRTAAPTSQPTGLGGKGRRLLEAKEIEDSTKTTEADVKFRADYLEGKVLSAVDLLPPYYENTEEEEDQDTGLPLRKLMSVDNYGASQPEFVASLCKWALSNHADPDPLPLWDSSSAVGWSVGTDDCVQIYHNNIPVRFINIPSLPNPPHPTHQDAVFSNLVGATASPL